MEAFGIRLIIGIALYFLVQEILKAFGVTEPGNRIFILITLGAAILFIFFGGFYFR